MERTVIKTLELLVDGTSCFVVERVPSKDGPIEWSEAELALLAELKIEPERAEYLLTSAAVRQIERARELYVPLAGLLERIEALEKAEDDRRIQRLES